jgi:hypothetical protein
MTPNQNLEAAAALIRGNTPNLRLLIQLLEDGGQKKLAAELRKPAPPTIQIAGRPRCNPTMWLEGRVR